MYARAYVFARASVFVRTSFNQYRADKIVNSSI